MFISNSLVYLYNTFVYIQQGTRVFCRPCDFFFAHHVIDSNSLMRCGLSGTVTHDCV
jgi:hypothetical protein